MPTMKNPRSLFLQNANPRLLTSPNADVLLSASTPVFHVNNSGIPSTNIITFNAILIAMEGTVTFTCEGGTLSNIVGNTCALNYETLTGETATVTATLTYRNQTKSDTVEISKLYDGQNGVVGANNAVVYAWQRSATQPTGNPGAVQYSFAASSITNTTLANGWQKTLPAGTGPLWIIAATASGTGTTDNIAANEWSGAVLLGQDGQPGNPGINSAAVTIYQRTVTTSAPALPSAATTYTFSPAGLTGLNNGWTTTLPAASAGKYLWASTATAASISATDSIAANEWAAAQMLVQDGAKGDTGSRGNVQVARAIPGSTWSDSEAALAISGAGYGTPQNRDIVILYNNSAVYTQQKYYDGAAWQALAAYFPGGVIVDGTVDATALKAQTITGDKIAAGAITASKITVGPTGALNKDPNFEDFAGTWTYTGAVTISGAGGSAPAKKYAGASGGAVGVVYSETMPIDSTKTYTLHASVYADPANTRSCYLFVNFYDSSGAQITSTGWESSGFSGYVNSFVPNAGDWRPYVNNQFGAGTAKAIPTAAKSCKIVGYLNSSATGTSSTLMGITAFKLMQANDGSLIVAGAITANKITITEISELSPNVGLLTSRAQSNGVGVGAGTEIQGDQIRIYDEGGNLRQLDGRLW